MVRWSPASELTNLHSAMDRLFGDLLGEAIGSSGGRDDRTGPPSYRLPVDVVEVDNGYRIEAPVPGFRPEDVEVTFSDGILSIRAKRSEERRQQDGDYVRREVAFGNYERQIVLPGNIQAEKIKAGFDNGMLTIEVPRARRPQPLRIDVQRPEQRQLAGEGSNKS
jgi:HSP20 family protein